MGKVVWVLRLCCLPEGENIRDPEKTGMLSAVRLVEVWTAGLDRLTPVMLRSQGLPLQAMIAVLANDSEGRLGSTRGLAKVRVQCWGVG